MGLRDRSKNLKEVLIKQEEARQSKKGNKGDKRYLNYFDLKEGEKMTIRLLPDGGESGEYWIEHHIHQSKVRGVKSIACAYTSSGEDCPVCTYSYDFFLDGKKDMASDWRKNNKFLTQCLVIDAPFEVNETDDGNPVKLFNMPFKIYEILKEAIMEEQVGDLMDCDFIIKQTKNSGGRAAYDKSFFAKIEEPLADGIMDAFDSGELELFDLSKEIPDATTTDEMGEWLDDALAKQKKAARTSSESGSSDSGSDDDDDDDGDNEVTPSKKSSASALLAKLKNKDNKKE